MAKARRHCRSREGAWIEIKNAIVFSDPSFCRSREGAWIEMPDMVKKLVSTGVAPVRERGLKYAVDAHGLYSRESLP